MHALLSVRIFDFRSVNFHSREFKKARSVAHLNPASTCCRLLVDRTDKDLRAKDADFKRISGMEALKFNRFGMGLTCNSWIYYVRYNVFTATQRKYGIIAVQLDSVS